MNASAESAPRGRGLRRLLSLPVRRLLLPVRWLRLLPLRTRLAVASGLAVALVALACSTAAFVVVRHELERQFDIQLGQDATFAAQQSKNQAPQVISGECRYLAAPACSQLVSASPAQDPARGYVLPVGPRTREVAAGEHRAYYSDITLDGFPVRMYTVSYAPGTAVQVAARSDTVRTGVRQAAWLMAAVCAGGMLLAALLGYLVARGSLRPVARLTAVAERIAATGDASLRIQTPSGAAAGAAGRRWRPDEPARLAASFNTMLAELEESVDARRRLVADASHELRTPLTALRTNAELLIDAERLTPRQTARAARAVDRQAREITGLVNDLIELARTEEPDALVEVFALDRLVHGRVEAARDHWPELAFTDPLTDAAADPAADPAAGGGHGILVRGVPQRLARLVDNLLGNAAKYSPPAGRVEVALGVVAGADGETAELTVRDHGPGIAPEDLPHVFDRFYRSASARALPGSGLGLAMAQQIARSHQAELTVANAPGGGASFQLRIPITRVPL
ncbi:HAMP domain-containing histidine kinase [Catenulispora sp. NL8]|uniref:histidine kinase n=1 Tax=Catenulispora pinistramenti TaxID=2705254 RepID=A0ABS5KJ11_9ACTN|nr:HAMP domain-containing sensor histidine kinase [Catenulispora pinistramenti]MBS2545885.1 HAMP domain-containing histidine kinase [Catenulispora pinistramenti]